MLRPSKAFWDVKFFKIYFLYLLSMFLVPMQLQANCGRMCDLNSVSWWENVEPHELRTEINNLANFFDLFDSNEYGYDALHLASKFGNPVKIQILLDHGLRLNTPTKNGETPLHLAAESTNNVEYLLKVGANPNAINQIGDTPLFKAAYAKTPSNAEFLVDAGAKINHRNKKGWSPLHYAVRIGGSDVVRYLLSAGSDLEIRSIFGDTALHNLANRSRFDESFLLILELLINGGIDVNAKNLEGKTALHNFVELGEETAILRLVQAGADVLAKDREGLSPWDYANMRKSFIGTEAYWAINDARFK